MPPRSGLSAATAAVLAAAALQLAACAAALESVTLDSEYRPDVYLPFDEYAEPAPIPNGTRMFVIGAATGSGLSQNFFFNGAQANMSLGQNESTWPIDFVHVYPTTLTQGEPFFMVFHSRMPEWHSIPTASVRVTDAAGQNLVNGSFQINRKPSARITSVTTDGGGARVIVHLRSYSPAAVTLTKVYVNGVAVVPIQPASLPQLPSGESVLLVLPAPGTGGPLPPGAVVTVKVAFADGTAAIAGARRLVEFFPVETWPKSSECPYPTVNDTNYAIHRSHGVDTFFTTDGSTSKCKNSLLEVDIINKLAPQYDFWVLAGKSTDTSKVVNTSRLAGWFLGDEDDNHATLTDNLRRNADDTRTLWEQFAGIPTYVGGSRNRFRGAWSNSVDALGMDAYIAACAPHVTNWGLPQNPLFSYDYLRITRDNHMPWPTWLYSQAFDSFWNADILGTVVVRQPDPAELAVSLQSVLAAGGKGLMLFQTQISLMPDTPASWQLLGTKVREIGAARELYRLGDLAGPVDTGGSKDTVAELVASPRALVLLTMNVRNDGGYADITCAIGGNDHWKFLNNSIPVTFATPQGWPTSSSGGAASSAASASPFADAFELRGGAVIEVDGAWSASPGPGGSSVVSFASLAMGSDGETITRTIVFANDKALRGEIAAALKPWGSA
ncbi:hypothetical protein FNF29_05238 [Cafeteria roenbergensis]|uniref:NodB homology domain-containing protein n=1 Tax=Cafeteria roenbergensis TaxID=33653 RepID=A0A5A8CBY3_CAFRO|nr:hypothetical protein FNF29_05238 [Cafeteria roenbergensis]|eukprot:KAA0150435.1 hypothetical protein FNF29_05238 [Cafeteria roenbergensis]